MHVRHAQATDFEGMKRLVVVGNGFDIHHGMRSSYGDFRRWLQATDGDADDADSVLGALARYFPLSVSEDVEWWNEFETNLATLAPSEIVADAVDENQPDFASDDFRDSDWYRAAGAVDDVISGLYSRILEKFTEWISEVNGTYDGSRRFVWSHRDTDGYLTFNYTDTLEQLYGVPACRVLHIHGQPATAEPLVLGHDGDLTFVEEDLERSPEPPDDLDVEDYEEWYAAHADDYVTSEAKNSARDAVMHHRKPVAEIIDSLRLYFASCASLEEVIVIGLSYSAVDMPYLRRIAACAPSARFTLTYYTESDRAAAEAFARTLSPRQSVRLLSTTALPLLQPPLPLD